MNKQEAKILDEDPCIRCAPAYGLSGQAGHLVRLRQLEKSLWSQAKEYGASDCVSVVYTVYLSV